MPIYRQLFDFLSLASIGIVKDGGTEPLECLHPTLNHHNGICSRVPGLPLRPAKNSSGAIVVNGANSKAEPPGGVAAGLTDFTAITGKEPISKSGKLNQYKLALQGYYDNYTSTVTKPSCK